MSLRQRIAAMGRDGNHNAVVRALRAAGCTVVDLAKVGGGVPDLLVGYRGGTYLLEIKDGALEPARRRLRPSQVEFFAKWRGHPPTLVHGVDEAFAAVGVTRAPESILVAGNVAPGKGFICCGGHDD